MLPTASIGDLLERLVAETSIHLGAAAAWWRDLSDANKAIGIILVVIATALFLIGLLARRRSANSDARPRPQIAVSDSTRATPPRTIKAFRLFVSSTFADFVVEREILQKEVFPALDRHCASKGYQFHPLDLRWGVSEEAQLDQRTTEICLGEVAAAQSYPAPNILIMIGDRYGWVPLPYAITSDEFEAIGVWLKRHGEQMAARELGTVYRHDENYLLPPGLRRTIADDAGISAYTLRSREDELPELKAAETWKAQEDRLRRALQKAADALMERGKIDASARDKYFLSLTEQEVNRSLAGDVDSTAPSPSTDRRQPIAFIRKIVGGLAPGSRYVEEEQDPDVCEGRLARHVALKDRIKRLLPDAVITATATRQADDSLDDAYRKAFAAQILKTLKSAVDQHITSVEAEERAPEFGLKQERDEHRAFADQRRRIFVGQQRNRAAIAGYLAGSANHPLVLYGRSGLGKSALMAKAIAEAELTAGGVPVVYRFIGASAASSDFRALFVSLIEDLAVRRICDKPQAFEDDANKFAEQVRVLLSFLASPVIIFLDALDQLHRPYYPLWLPQALPSGVKLVLSVLDDEAYRDELDIYEDLRRRLPEGAFLEVEPLDPRDGREILLALEADAQRRLRDSQRDYIISQFKTADASPLWLRTAFEIARSWTSTDVPGKGQHALATNTTAIIRQFIDELTDVHHHARPLVARVLGYLTAAKDGLSAKELTDVLSVDEPVRQAIAFADTLPASVWVRLRRQLDPFLVEKRIDDQPLLQFFHRQVAEVAREQHYRPSRAVLHTALADNFDIHTTKPDGRNIYDKRTLSELPHQLHHAEATSRLNEILMSPDWMQQKLNTFGPRALIDDYQFARTEAHQLIGQAVELVAGTIARDKRQLLPQLLGRLIASIDAAVARLLEDARRHVKPVAIIPLRQSLTPPGAEIARLEGHTQLITSLCLLPGGCLASAAWDDTIRIWNIEARTEVGRFHANSVSALVMAPNGRLASAGRDGVRLWDLATGAEASRIKGGWCHALSVLPHLVIAGSERTILLWDIDSGTEVMRLEGHTADVKALAVLPDGRLASAGKDGIRLWDLTAGTEVNRLGDDRDCSALAVLHDGRLASAGNDGVRLWDLTTATEVARLEEWGGLVNALSVLPDGRLASARSDNTIRLWNVETSAEVGRLEGHAGFLSALCSLPNGRLASAGWDETIRLWRLDVSGPISRSAHNSGVKTVAVLPEGRVASAGWDATILIWNIDDGTEIMRLEGDTADVNALAVLPDGRLASAGRDGIQLWNLEIGTDVGTLGDDDEIVTALAVLPDGHLASAGNRQIRLWDLSDDFELATFGGYLISSLIILPDGRLASAGSDDKTITLWNTHNGAEVMRLEGHARGVNALALLPDGRLASAAMDEIRLWDLTTGSLVGHIEKSHLKIRGMCALPRGRLASVGEDRTIRLWDLVTGGELACLDVDAAVHCLAALPNGCLVAGDSLGRLHWLEIVE